MSRLGRETPQEITIVYAYTPGLLPTEMAVPYSYQRVDTIDKSETSDEEVFSAVPLYHRRRPSVLTWVLMGITVVVLAVCSGLVGARIYRTRIDRDFLDPQAIVPECKSPRKASSNHC